MKIAFSLALAFVLSMFCFPNISVPFNSLFAPSNAFPSSSSSFAKVGEIWDGTNFNVDNVNTLLKCISNSKSINVSDLTTISNNITTTSGINSATIRSSSVSGKTSGQDVVVRIAGLDWTPTYVSESSSGDIILTLWLTNNEQEAWQARTGHEKEGGFYGFVKGPDTNKIGLYSDWSGDWAANTVYTYPPNMYGTSYIRAVTLNNGGSFVTIGGESLSGSYQKNTNSVFAKFTMDNVTGNLTNYIVTPTSVSWQKTQSAKTNGDSYNNSNEAWDPSTSSTGFYSANYNYAAKKGYNTWQNDYLWLPSITELKYIWTTGTSQNKNYDGKNSQSILGETSAGEDGEVTSSILVGGGTDAGTGVKGYADYVCAQTWLRSSAPSFYNLAYALNTSGLLDGGVYYTGISYAVRPAFHLNLTKVCAKCGSPFDAFLAAGSYPGITSKSDGYHITDYTGIKALSDYTNNQSGTFDGSERFFLDNDIMMESSFKPLATFSGVFDGQDHSLIKLRGPGFIVRMVNGSIKDLNILNWICYTSTSPMSFVTQASGDRGCSFINLYIDCSLTSNLRGMSALLGALSAGTLCNITYVGIEGILNCTAKVSTSATTALFYPAAFIWTVGDNATVSVDQSYFKGVLAHQETTSRYYRSVLCGDGANAGNSKYAMYSGVYVYIPANSIKTYYAGFSDSDWVCSGTVNGGYPAIRHNLHVGGSFASTSVETYLTGKSFKKAT